MNTTPSTIRSQFLQDLAALRAKYPMVYVETWTPDDFTVILDSNREAEAVDWQNERHQVTADNLRRHFDAEHGTNWERVAMEAAP